MAKLNSNNIDIYKAARLLEAGFLVAFPTETVYGLGGDAENENSLKEIFNIKKRPHNNPLIIHVHKDNDIERWVKNIPEDAQKLINQFWPGPLSLLMKSSSKVSKLVTAGLETICIRSPSHVMAISLLKEFKDGKGAIAAPSANKFGKVSPTSKKDVLDEFGQNSIPFILDGGKSQIGIESTILDLTNLRNDGPLLLRPGHITPSQIAEILGKMPKFAENYKFNFSGNHKSHYAPLTPLVVLKKDMINKISTSSFFQKRKISVIYYSKEISKRNTCFFYVLMPKKPVIFAQKIYSTIRYCDKTNSELILIEKLPDEELWYGISDRINKAAHNSKNIFKNLLSKIN